jgi:hypothetical protein
LFGVIALVLFHVRCIFCDALFGYHPSRGPFLFDLDLQPLATLANSDGIQAVWTRTPSSIFLCITHCVYVCVFLLIPTPIVA